MPLALSPFRRRSFSCSCPRLRFHPAAALEGGQQSFPAHVFPFRMTARNLELHKDSKWIGFWRNLGEGYERFERDGVPPEVSVSDRRYRFSR